MSVSNRLYWTVYSAKSFNEHTLAILLLVADLEHDCLFVCWFYVAEWACVCCAHLCVQRNEINPIIERKEILQLRYDAATAAAAEAAQAVRHQTIAVAKTNGIFATRV